MAKQSKTIVFTGGGSTGHVSVNLALIPYFLERDWIVEYIGSTNGIEKQLLSRFYSVKYNSITTGKLRRYLDWNNVIDAFKVLKGIFEAFVLIWKIKPQVIFSKGGFVSFPVVVAGWLNRVPVILHESDVTLGLANKLALPFVSKICMTFKETEKYVSSQKGIFIGPIIREDFKAGCKNRGAKYCGFSLLKSTLLVIGGSLGSQTINSVIRESLQDLLSTFQIVHICGKGNIDESLNLAGYQQYEYINNEFADVLALADIVISRAGANSIFEFLFMKKPMILVPLSKKASRGDQIINANAFKKSGFCEIISDEELNANKILDVANFVNKNREQYIKNMQQQSIDNPTIKLVQIIEQACD